MVVADTPILLTTLKGVGAKTAQQLAKLHLHTLQDVLFHLPLRYEDRTKITPIIDAKAGDRILIEGTVTGASVIGRGRRQMVCRIDDGTAVMTLRFFHFNADQLARLKEQDLRLRCFGEVREGLQRQLEMSHPEYQALTSLTSRLALTNRLTPIYPTTQGVGQNLLRRLTSEALQWLQYHQLAELLPETLRQQFELVSIAEALQYIHHPPVDADQELLQAGEHPMQQRLAFEELLAHQLYLLQLRNEKRRFPANALNAQGVLKKQLIAQLPFQLTTAQQRVLSEIESDLAQPLSMMRLVQGDVGSGKTIVAAISALCAIESGYQVAMMAPTELLAEQHYKNFKQWFEPLGLNVGFLISGVSQSQRKQVLASLVEGELSFVVGTHALFQKEVAFKKLTLIIIDEQHRFGVHQRMALHDKGLHGDASPHQLIMTATPIPRTLSMTAYADLDCSVIDVLPQGRKPIETVLVSADRRQQIVERVLVNCQQGAQAYWVCTLIEESEALQCQAAENTVIELRSLLPDLRIGLVHGRMKTAEKDQVMMQFKNAELDLLVATTVIEVGVDVPNATLMIIDNPERLGLAQLHQLRGRVGRGSKASFCVLLYKKPLSMQAQQRLQIMRDHRDGFKIAEADLKLRGPGEVLGTRQSGLMQFRIADLLRDEALIDHVREAGQLLIAEFPLNAEAIVERWLGAQLNYLSS